MKKIICLALFLITYQIYAQCPNGDIEQGSYNNFTRMSGTFSSPLNLMQLNGPVFIDNSITPPAARHAVINSPAGPHTIPDPNVPLVTLSEEGFYVMRINNWATNKTNQSSQKDGVYYTFQVTNANKLFKFKYAMVLEDGGHAPSDQPSVTFFMNVLYPCGIGTIPHVPSPPMNGPFYNNQCIPYFYQKQLDWNLFNQTFTSKSADLNNPFFKRGAGNIVYKNWQCVQYDLSQYVGQTVSLCVMASQCIAGVHYGYVYLDGLCKPNIATANFNLTSSTFCINNDIILNGAASVGEDRYFLEIAQCDQAGNLTPNGDIKSWWTLGAEVPNGLSIKNEYINHGGTWKCNTFYKVKLAVMSECAPWHSVEQVIKFACPELPTLSSQFACCPSKVQGAPCFNLTVPNPLPGYSYNWASTAPTGINLPGANAQYCGKKSNIFKLTVTDPNGCVGVVNSTVFVQGNLSASLNTINVNQSCAAEFGCNNAPVTVNYNTTPCEEGQSEIFNPLMQGNAYNYWVTYPFMNWQGYGTSFTPSSPGNYAAVVANSCKQLILPFVGVVKQNYVPEVLAPNAFNPNSVVGNNEFKIFDFGPTVPPIGQGPAYGKAIDFELKIFDRFGGNFRTITKTSPSIGLGPNDCLKNGDIRWDGKDNAGNIVPNDVYTYCLSLKLCDGNWYCWQVNKPDNGIGCIRMCTRIINRWPFIQRYCCQSCCFAYHVTVVN